MYCGEQIRLCLYTNLSYDIYSNYSSYLFNKMSGLVPIAGFVHIDIRAPKCLDAISFADVQLRPSHHHPERVATVL